MTALAAVLVMGGLLWYAGTRWTCSRCGGFMVPVAGWDKKTCPECGLTERV